jgi:hypothetical protein
LIDGLQNGQQYCYYVTQVFPDGSESCPSNVMCATPFAPCTEPEAFAGLDQIVCETENISLSEATAADYEFITWTTTGDGTFDDPQTINPVYQPGQVDLSVGNVTLCLNAQGFFPCGTATDCIDVTFAKTAAIEIGLNEDQICFGADYTFLLTQAENYSSIQWSTPNGTGVFTDPNGLKPTYIPSSQDFGLGCVSIMVAAFPNEPCTAVAFDEMDLCFVNFPSIDAGEDDFVCRGNSYQLNGEAESFAAIIWTTSGDGVFSNSSILNPIYTPGQVDLLIGSAALKLTVLPVSPCTEIAEDEMILSFYDCQVTNIPEGWSGFSSYLQPFNSDLEVIFSPVMNDLIILQTLQNSWWPAENINTIGNWNVLDGYQVKVAQEVSLTIAGSRLNSPILNLSQGWNLIPVLSPCDANIEELFAQTGVIMIKEVAGWRVYWPGLGINSLETLEPGKAYFVLMANTGAIQFPECQGLKTQTNTEPVNPFAKIDLPYFGNEISRSPISHIIALPSDVRNSYQFASGNIVVAVDSYGHYFGIAEWTGENETITIFGDDPLTPHKDGFVEGENLRFMKLDLLTGAITDLAVEFDADYPQTDGKFSVNGLSVIKSIETGITSYSNSDKHISIYPNPFNQSLTISTDQVEDLDYQIMNVQGQIILSGKIRKGNGIIEVSAVRSGIYLIRLTTDKTEIVRRIVKQ